MRKSGDIKNCSFCARKLVQIIRIQNPYGRVTFTLAQRKEESHAKCFSPIEQPRGHSMMLHREHIRPRGRTIPEQCAGSRQKLKDQTILQDAWVLGWQTRYTWQKLPRSVRVASKKKSVAARLLEMSRDSPVYLIPS